jgi:nucleotide-binding universal stress UspA family protein
MAPLKVLVPLDGSEFSRGLVPHICRLLSPKDHDLILMRVADEPVGVAGQPPRPLVLNALTMPEFATAMDVELAHHPIYASQQRDTDRAGLYCELMPVVRELESRGYNVKTEIRFGDAAEEITSYARSEHVDIVAIGTHGRTGLRRIALGSVTAEVLRTAPVPVLVVRLHEPVIDEPQVELFT